MSRPGSSQGTSSLAKLGLNISGKLDTRAEQEGEWMVLATFNKLQYEKEERERGVKLKLTQAESKKGLDSQELERNGRLQQEKREKSEYATLQTEELKKWEQREKAKFDKRISHVKDEEVFRKRQVRSEESTVQSSTVQRGQYSAERTESAVQRVPHTLSYSHTIILTHYPTLSYTSLSYPALQLPKKNQKNLIGGRTKTHEGRDPCAQVARGRD
jgi:hypothetical protein